jgi:hypothetical protein
VSRTPARVAAVSLLAAASLAAGVLPASAHTAQPAPGFGTVPAAGTTSQMGAAAGFGRPVPVPYPRITGIAAQAAASVVARRALAAPAVGKPQSVSATLKLTRNPGNNGEAAFTTPSDVCDPTSCREIEVKVPEGSDQTLYARGTWTNARQFAHVWGISPSGEVVGMEDVSSSVDKTTGNAGLAPVAGFEVPDPEAGTWRIQYRAVFGVDIPVRAQVALAKGKTLDYPRLDVTELANKYLTQKLTYNIVFVNRRWSKEEIATFREAMPTEYRPSVLGKEFSDGCGDGETGLESITTNWGQSSYCSTQPYFSAQRFQISYRFLEADQTWTEDLFATMKKNTTPDQPFAVLPGVGGRRITQGDYLADYDARKGKPFRGADAVVTNPTVGDKIDAFKTEDWIFASRNNKKYRSSFRNLETGKRVSARFITPDPGAYFDPFYDKGGKKQVDKMPQGAATSLSFFVMDTFNGELAAKYFRPNAYHFFDVSKYMQDPDLDEPDGPDLMRAWGGRYRFFMHDLGAGPNILETTDGFASASPMGSADGPLADPPIWQYDRDPEWAGLLAERTARDAKTMLLSRLIGSYLYRPVPADVYFLASNNWVDCYSNPQCSADGISYTDITKAYDAKYVERNLGAALPGATFLTERSNPKLETFRYLGCAKNRAVANPDPNTVGLLTGEPTEAPYVTVPDPQCVGQESDKFQEALEFAKSRGDTIAGGVNNATVNTETFRAFVEANRVEIAPQPAGQFTITNVSVVFPGGSTWALPAIVGGIALGTPNNEAWGILNNVNDRFKSAKLTDCSKSKPFAPGCNGVPPISGGAGFSYTVQHEASHFLGLLHPHNTVNVNKAEDGTWTSYADLQSWYANFSMAPTTYFGAFAPYSVNDQDIIQRGHVGEYFQQTDDYLQDAVRADAMAGRTSVSPLTAWKMKEVAKWRAQASKLFGCGDNLQSERAARNMFLAAQGVFGPVVDARQLKPGERVLFKVEPQKVYSVDGGAVKGCAGAGSGAQAAGPLGFDLPELTGPLPGMLPTLFAVLLFVVWMRRRDTTFA